MPENIGAMIESDATMFEVYKKDGRTINKNRFLGILIIGYYNDYVTEAKAAYDAILSAIDTNKVSIRDKERIADSILKKCCSPNGSFTERKKSCKAIFETNKGYRGFDSTDSPRPWGIRLYITVLLQNVYELL